MGAPTVYEVQTPASGTSSSSSTVSATITTPKAGSLLVAAVETTAVKTSTSITGWTLAVEAAFNSNAHSVGLWYRIADGSEGTTITANTGASRVYNAIVVHEYSGIAVSTPVVPIANASENQASANSNNFSHIVANNSTKNWLPVLTVTAVGLTLGNTGGSWSCSDTSPNMTCYSGSAQQRLCTSAVVGPEYTTFFSPSYISTAAWSWSTARTHGLVAMHLPLATQVVGGMTL